MLTIGHIVNPVLISKKSDLFIAQPITFESMRIAREAAQGKVDVSFFSAQYPEDRSFVPPFMTMTDDLDRSMRDLTEQGTGKKLPLIKDILDRLYEASDAEYLIYTNVDISLVQHFYCAVATFIEEGYDGFTITRRQISDRFRSTDELAQMYLEEGKPHRGWDCFVFRRSLYPQFFLGDVFIGAPAIGRSILCNLIRYADKVGVFSDEHLTFHLGRDSAWVEGPARESRILNRRNALTIVRELHGTAPPGNRKDRLKRHAEALSEADRPVREKPATFRRRVKQGASAMRNRLQPNKL